MAGPKFDDLLRAGGRLEQRPQAPRFADLAQRGGRVETTPGTVEALVRGPIDYVTRGWSDEIQGAAESRFPRLSLPIGEFFDPNVPTPAAKTYEEARDANHKLYRRTAEAEPVPYHGAGITAALLTPGLKGKGLLGAVGVGAAEGAAAGAGNSTADTATGVLDDAVSGAEVGGLFGAGGYGVVRGIQKGVSKIGDLIRGRATQAEEGVRAGEAARLADETQAVRTENQQAVRNASAEYLAKVEERRDRLAQQTSARQARADDAAARGLISEAEAARAAEAARENRIVVERARELLRRARAGDRTQDADALMQEAEGILASAEARAGQEAATYASTHRNLLSTYMDSGRPLPQGAEGYAASVYDDAAQRVSERASEGTFDPSRVFNRRVDQELGRASALEQEANALRSQPRPDTQQLAQQVVGELQPAGPVVDTPEQAAIRTLLRARGLTRDPATLPVLSPDEALRAAQRGPRMAVPDYQGGRARLPALRGSPEGTLESRTAEALQRGRETYQRTGPIQGTVSALSDGNPLKAAAQLTTLPQLATLVKDPLARAAWLKDTATAATWAQGQVLARTNPELAARVSTRLASALQRGPDDYKATHYILQQQDPEYRQAMQQAQAQDLTEDELRMIGAQ